MVYCPKCGFKNRDGASVCKNCGESLYPYRVKKAVKRKEDTCFGPPERRERHVEECFGLPRGGTIVGMAIGLLIILFGVGWILSRHYGVRIEIWPVAVIIFGILIVAGALYRLRRG